jgi:hypothetical protein
MLLCVGLAVVVGVLAGCGGAGNPGSNNLAVAAAGVTPQALDPALVGSWMHVRARQDGVDGSLKNLEHWEGTAANAVRLVSVFKSNGVYTETFYNAAGAVAKFNNGVWSANAGTHTVTINWDGPYSCTYSISGNVLTLTATGGGHTRQIVLAKIVTPTAHDPALVKTWKATNVWVNGVVKPLSYLTGSTNFSGYARTLSAAGSSQSYFLNNGTKFVPPLPASQTWVSGGGVLKLGTGPIAEQIYVVASGQLTTWQLDGAGNTLKVLFKPFGATGGHDSRLLGTWHAVSGTLDGKSASLSTLFGWNAGTTKMRFTFLADGTEEDTYFGGSTLKYGNLGSWSTSGTTATVSYSDGQVVVVHYVCNSATAMTWTWSFTGDSHTRVAVLNSGP